MSLTEYLSDASKDARVRKTVHSTVGTVKKMKIRENGVNGYAAAAVLICGAVLFASAQLAGSAVLEKLKEKAGKLKKEPAAQE